MTKRKRPENHAGGTVASTATPIQRKKSPITLWILGILVLLVAARLVAVDLPRLLGEPHARPAATSQSADPLPASSEEEGMSISEIQAKKLIVNVHEHLGDADLAPKYLTIMDELGIGTMCLMGSSKFTLTLNESLGFTGYDENNNELIECTQRWPGRFAAWTVVNPLDPDKLDKFKANVARGAQGLKLYTGHGYVTKKGEYIFHPIAMDDPSMFPLYAYCQENFIPVCIHINPDKTKKGFAEEFVSVLEQFPDLKVVAPHCILSSKMSNRLCELLDTFPNLYTDVSYGDYFMKERLEYISEQPKKFKKLFHDYQDRFMFGTDLVLTEGYNKTEKWIRDQFSAYIDMLSKDTYTTDAIPGETLNGVNLPGGLLEKILFKNYHAMIASHPKGTKIAREINWDRMSVTPADRKPGETFPPKTKDSE